MQQLNRRQRRRLPNKPTADALRQQTTIMLINRITNYKEILNYIETAHTIKQIKTKIQERIDATQNYLTELNKDK